MRGSSSTTLPAAWMSMRNALRHAIELDQERLIELAATIAVDRDLDHLRRLAGAKVTLPAWDT